MINPPKLESIMLPTKEDLFNTGYTSCGGFSAFGGFLVQEEGRHSSLF
jgi:hypothetical protein